MNARYIVKEPHYIGVTDKLQYGRRTQQTTMDDFFNWKASDRLPTIEKATFYDNYCFTSSLALWLYDT